MGAEANRGLIGNAQNVVAQNSYSLGDVYGNESVGGWLERDLISKS